METRELVVDYLVVGARAMGMAFADTVVAESDKTVAIVDRGSRPGGH
jgi:UDP-galactopyranose mutase